MRPAKPILVITLLAGRLSVTASANTKATPVCPPGYGWAPELNDCMDCAVCDTMPETSVCLDCKGEEEPAVVPNESGFRQVKAQSDDTANFYQCPSGYEWHPDISDCMSCTVCDEMPNTYICDMCAKETKSVRARFQPGVIAVIAMLTMLTVCSMSMAAYCTWKRLQVGRNNGDDAESEARQPIQETADPDEIISGIETVV
ncbi:uncharacterized protein LOC144919168 [Branchiostoma floridae x Branchiostoma belcheri]